MSFNDEHSASPSYLAEKREKREKMRLAWRSDDVQSPLNETKKEEKTGLLWRNDYTQQPRNDVVPLAISKDAVAIYYYDGAVKVLVGVCDDKVKLARFSSTAGEQLTVSGDYEQFNNKHEVILDKVNFEAAVLILNWINSNTTDECRPMIHDVPNHSSFEFFCRLHQASYILQLRRELRGNGVRNAIYDHICSIRQPSFDQFKFIHEELDTIDSPLVLVMYRQTARGHAVSGLVEGEHSKIMNYCSVQGGLVKRKMRFMEMEIREELENKQKKQGEDQQYVHVHDGPDLEIKVTAAQPAPAKPAPKRKQVRLGTTKNRDLESKETGSAEQAEPAQGPKASYAKILGPGNNK